MGLWCYIWVEVGDVSINLWCGSFVFIGTIEQCFAVDKAQTTRILSCSSNGHQVGEVNFPRMLYYYYSSLYFWPCRQLALCQFPSWMLMQFIIHVLSVPASMLHLHTLAPDVMAHWWSCITIIMHSWYRAWNSCRKSVLCAIFWMSFTVIVACFLDWNPMSHWAYLVSWTC